ncbi:MAG: hypothetical protein ACE5DN_00125, partial [Flavobacteriales bacterium]
QSGGSPLQAQAGAALRVFIKKHPASERCISLGSRAGNALQNGKHLFCLSPVFCVNFASSKR